MKSSPYIIILPIQDKEIEITCSPKRMKNIRLKIDSNGKVMLSTPINYPKYKAKEFVITKLDWIEQSLNRLKNTKVDKFCSFKSGEEIYIWGEKRIVNLIFATKENVELEGVHLNIYTPDISGKNARKVFLKWAKSYFYGHLLDMFEIIYRSIFKKLKVNKPQLIIRTMKTMWGNCRYNKELVTLNFYLFKAPIDCINYVILHELAHLIYHDHGTNFKNFLTKYMPDWKIRKKRLNEFSLQF